MWALINYIKYNGRGEGEARLIKDERTSIVQLNRKPLVIRGKLLCSASWAKSPVSYMILIRCSSRMAIYRDKDLDPRLL